jgi:ATP-dependent helicase/nuclease subunit B
MPNIFNISAGNNFLSVLRKATKEVFGLNEIELARSLFILPSKRAAAEFAKEIIAGSDKQIAIIPKIIAIGEIDAEDFTNENNLKKIGNIERKIITAKLIHDYFAKSEKPISHKLSSRLASSVLSLIDDIETYKINAENLANIVPHELAEHWNLTLDFLKFILEQYPKILAERNLINPAKYRNIEIENFTKNLEENKYTSVFICGTTGSIPATRELIKKILSFKNGYLILPALDQNLPEDLWNKIGKDGFENHHQATIKSLLNFLNCKDRSEIKNLGESFESEKTSSEIFAPLEENSNNLQKNTQKKFNLNIKTLTASNIFNEAKLCGIAIRKNLAENKKVALITNNSELINYTKQILKIWNVNIDDSTGQPFTTLPLFKLITDLSQCLQNNFNINDIFTLLKNPLYKSQNFENFSQIYNDEKKIRSTIDFENPEFKTQKILNEINYIRDFFAKADANFSSDKIIFNAHLNSILEFISQSDEQLLKHEQNSQLKEILNEITSSNSANILIKKDEFLDFLSPLILDKKYREKYGFTPNISIVSPIEARLLNFDTIILGDVNFGSWPRQYQNIWMNRSMMKEFEMPTKNITESLSSHDFYSLIHAGDVYISRHTTSDNSTTTPSPLLSRILMFLEAANINPTSIEDAEISNWLEIMEGERDEKNIAIPVAPKASFAEKPQKLSVTKIEKLFSNPYEIYAREILKLRKLPELYETLQARDIGSLIHKVVEEFVIFHKNKIENILQENFINIANKYLANLTKSETYYYQIFIEDLAKYFCEVEKNRIQNLKENYNEIEGEYNIPLGKLIFKLTAKADRILVYNNNEVEILDYKTGNPPSDSDIKKLKFFSK